MPSGTLAHPQFGNVWEINFQMKPRRSTANQLLVVKDDNWPNIEKMKVTYQALSQSAKDTLVTILFGWIGDEIILTDWEGRIWTGAISSDIETTQVQSTCGYEVTFEFEGIKQPA